MTILHIFKDDKFLDSAFDTFDNIDSEIDNKYVFFTKVQDFKFVYIKKTERITIINDFEEYIKLFFDKDVDVLFFHSINPLWYNYFQYIDKRKIVVWRLWGYDIYHNDFRFPIIEVKKYKTLTSEIIDQPIPTKLKQLKRIIRKVLFLATTFKYYRDKIEQKNIIASVISRVDYFAPVISLEYDLLNKKNYFRAKKFYFRYNSIPEYSNVMESSSSGENILIGNSATPTNNHMDILKKMSNFDLKGRQLILPLNYGDTVYKERLLDEIERMQISGLMILNDFLSFDEYNNILKTCSFFVFGHIRQQAIGNILLGLSKGIKIFLYKESITYKFLKNKGFFIYSIDDDMTEKSLKTPLNYTEKLHNYSLNIEYSLDINQSFKDFISCLKKDCSSNN